MIRSLKACDLTAESRSVQITLRALKSDSASWTTAFSQLRAVLSTQGTTASCCESNSTARRKAPHPLFCTL